MASEKYFARFDENLWVHHVPLLSMSRKVQFFSAINTHASRRQFADKFSPQEVPALNDVIAEISFAHTARVFGLKSSGGEFGSLVVSAVNRINTISGKHLLPENVSCGALRDAIGLSHRLEVFLQEISIEPPVFHPKLKGFGSLNTCSPDILVGDFLVEVKTSSYGFRLEDFRQLFLYLFLADKNRITIRDAILVNPRLGSALILSANDYVEFVTQSTQDLGLHNVARYFVTS